ncbi:class I SAM-dependent methyltransferase [Campylobacter pinnipediorum]|uniref:class I SAM-dependent methyltransferase n=1 Tax=Campylobacter pinnipediorum TaxID=1965231 RepID=UPI00084D3A4F|nr:class I SAM-dependent methyltransferase [Campylobacter pinnipediorum]AQW81849.1 SAM-dependent methyltransferase [Campylobacter pinnipediorum subsp. pinnipediorum]
MLQTKDTYDDVPYFSAAFVDSSPFRLQAVATFLNIKNKSLENARVLELGCSYGGNILPFAIHNKNADVVGIDMSKTQVSIGNKISKEAGVKNFELIQKNILDLTQDDYEKLGKFDYIIAHGLYSWVDDDVKKSVLKLIKNVLAVDGISYISYNVYPGWNSFEILREYMLFVSSDESSYQGRLQKSKDELEFFKNFLRMNLQNIQNQTLKDSTKLLLTQLDFLKNITKDKKNDYYILHDFLEICNKPIYFNKFIKEIQEAGLCYLLDSTLDDIFNSSFGVFRFDEHIKKNYPKRVQKEQMKDFFQNRSFRKSLVMNSEILGSNDDFDVQIGIDEISKLNLIVKLIKKDDIFYIKDRALNTSFNDIFERFYEAYPSSLNMSDFKDKDTQNVFYAFLELISDVNTVIVTREFKKLDYVVGKTRLKEDIRGYVRYFANADEPVILFADALNQKVELDRNLANIALEFDGKNSIDFLEKKFDKDSVLKVYSILQKAYFFESF